MENLDLTFVNICNQKSETVKHNKKENAYCLRKKTEKRENIITNLILILGVLLLIALLGVKIANTEPRYVKADGNCYVYVTEKLCEVTEVTSNYITVSYKGNEYSFHGYDYEVGQEIICQFTDEMEIVGVVE